MAGLSRGKKILIGLGLAIVAVAAPLAWYPRLFELLMIGEERKLPTPDEPAAAVRAQPLLVIALDGVDRSLLYDMLHRGQLPELAALLGERDGHFPHAFFDDTLLSVLPSSTLAAWASVFTGVPPAHHGVAGNEFFIRETKQLAAPAPVSIQDASPVLAIYTDGYANALLRATTVYERMHERGLAVSSWVCMSQFYRGADRLLLAGRTVLADAFKAMLTGLSHEGAADGLYSEFDEEVVDTLLDALSHDAAPDVITLYLTGADLYAHRATRGPDVARTEYLREVLDPLLGKLRRTLAAQDALRDRTILVTSDHGHTEVVEDAAHALSTDDELDPPAVVRAAGYRLRDFELEVAEDAPFQVVLAYGGAMAYVYVADRSTCVDAASPCDWSQPPRFREDVLPLADAFFEASRSGRGSAKMRNTLDFVLTREPVRFDEQDRPFQVYVGGGELVPLERYLAQHPHPTYVAFPERLRELAVGPYGERAGDILLIAHNGDRERPEERYYFAGPYRSWHGSPSRKDSEVPLIVAHPQRTTAELRHLTQGVLGDVPRQYRIAELMMEIVRPSREKPAARSPAQRSRP